MAAATIPAPAGVETNLARNVRECAEGPVGQHVSPGSRCSNCIGRFALLVCAGIAVIEAAHTAHILLEPVAHRLFPQGYMSKGIWANYAYIRPLDPTSPDIVGPLEAARKVLQGSPGLYTGFVRSGFCFIYPPTAAIELLPICWVAGEALPRAIQIMDLLGRACVLGTVLAALAFVRGWVCGPRNWVLMLVMLFAFFPLRWALFCVNAQTVISLFLAGAVLAYAHSRGILCGVLIGLCACMKPYAAPLVLFAIVRREWRVAAAAMMTAALLIAASLVLVGFGPWEAYAHEVLPVVSAGYALWGNQTVHALVRRWNGDPQIWELTAVSAGVACISSCAFGILLVCTLLPRDHGTAAVSGAAPDRSDSHAATSPVPPHLLFRGGDIGIALLLLTMASPIAWDHYYGWTIVLFCICLAAGQLLAASRVYYVLLGASYAMLATDWIPVARGRPGIISVLDSPKLFAAVLLLGISWHACRKLRGTHAGSATICP